MRLSLALCVLFWACGDKPVASSPARVVAEDVNLEPSFRLGDASRPTSIALHLQLDPMRAVFGGVVDINIDIAQPLHTIWLHQRDLVIESAQLQRAGHSEALIIRQPAREDSELFALDAARLLEPGPARLHIAFKAHFGNMDGLFRQKEEGRWYTYSDFEATDARAAFPCYDEPRFKVPWSITIDAPEGSLAFANTKEVSRESLGDGRQRFGFATTRPMPSYLVAMAVGPFDLIEGRASKTPLRIIAPRGQAENGRFVLENTDTWLRFFESYLGMDLPYDKLDFIAVPHFGGAMENPGLVTFTSAILLIGDNASDEAQRQVAAITNHELAHMWFGDLITPRYWDDLWLNEGFATWLSDKAMASYQPHRAREILNEADKSIAFGIDHNLDGPPVRQPLNATEDVREAFGAITYRKGGALLTMLEAWLGESRMQRVVRQYARQSIDSTVTTEDLFSELVSVTGTRESVGFLRSFLNQSGIPTIAFKLSCQPAPRLHLQQRRYLPLRTQAAASPSELERRWQLPVCFRYGAGGDDHRQCVFMSETIMQVDLQGSCPTWIQPNDGDNGYYHAALSGEHFATLSSRPLDAREVLGLVHNVVYAVRSGELPLAVALPILEPYAQRGPLELQEILVPFLAELSLSVVGQEERGAFSAMVRRWYGARINTLGLVPSAGEAQSDTLLRASLVQTLAELGDDKELQAASSELVPKLLNAPQYIDLGTFSAILEAAAVDGDRALQTSYLHAMRTTKHPLLRALLLGAMHAFRKPTLFAEALERSMVRAKHHPYFWPILLHAMRDTDRKMLIFAALDKHLPALIADDKDDTQIVLEHISQGLCSEKDIAILRSVVGDALDTRALITEIRGCMAFAASQRTSDATFSAAQTGK